MTGLVWQDTLSLPLSQWCLLTTITGASLSIRTRRGSTLTDSLFTFSALYALLWAFWQQPFGIDILTTWQVLPTLSRTGWGSEFAFANYLKLQPPLWTWWLLRIPVFAFHQSVSVSLGALLFALYYMYAGRQTAFLLLACPLFHLLIIQPSNDLYVCVLLCVAVVLRTRLILSSLCLWLACCLKYTTYAMLPLLMFTIPWQVLSADGFIVGYWMWALSLDAFWPREQARYLLHSFTFGQISYYVRIRRSSGAARPMWLKVWRTLLWRWRTLGRGAVLSAWWYAFPWYAQRVPWLVVLGWLGLTLGFGNVKYWSLLLPVWLAAQTPQNSANTHVCLISCLYR